MTSDSKQPADGYFVCEARAWVRNQSHRFTAAMLPAPTNSGGEGSVMSERKKAPISAGERTLQSPLGALPDSFFDSVAHSAEQEGLSASELGRRFAQQFLEDEFKHFNRPKVGHPRQTLRNVIIMHWIEVLRANPGGKKMRPKKVAIPLVIREIRDRLGITLEHDTVLSIYKEYKYPTPKRRQPIVLEMLAGTAPMTDRELRAHYRDVGMTIEHLLNQFRLIQASANSLSEYSPPKN